MQTAPNNEARLIAEKQFYAGLAIAGADYPDQPGAEIVAVFGLTDPEAGGGIFRDDGSFTSWQRPIVAYAGEMLNVINMMGENIGGDPAIATQALEEMRAVAGDFDARAALPKAGDIAREHKAQLEAAKSSGKSFGRKMSGVDGDDMQAAETTTTYKKAFGRKGVPEGVTPVRPVTEKKPRFGRRKSPVASHLAANKR